MALYHHFDLRQCGFLIVITGFIAVLSFGSPIQGLVRQLRTNYSLWTAQEDDIRRMFNWVKFNTPEDSIIIMPPWRRDSWYFSQRAQIASYLCPVLDRLSEWRERIEAMCGKIEKDNWQSKINQLKKGYNDLTKKDIQSLVRKYGSDYIITSQIYDFPLIHELGDYKVYSLNKGQTP